MSPRAGKLFATTVATVYALYFAPTTSDWHFFDNVDLLIHEAGHVLFSPFGEFIQFLMGSGFQILFPLVFVAYFFRQRAYYSASFLLFWVAINIINVSVYVGDAQRMALPLLGGEHDWNWLLSHMHVLAYTDAIARSVYAFGIALIAVAAYLSASRRKAGCLVDGVESSKCVKCFAILH